MLNVEGIKSFDGAHLKGLKSYLKQEEKLYSLGETIKWLYCIKESQYCTISHDKF